MSEELNDSSNEIGGAESKERVSVSFHPLGGIGIQVTDANGQTSAAMLDKENASVLVSHIDALISMLYQSEYMRAIQENMRIAQMMSENDPGLWTPEKK